MSESFEAFMVKVDRRIEAVCGLTSEDLPDIDYYSRYVDEVSPSATAQEALREAGWR